MHINRHLWHTVGIHQQYTSKSTMIYVKCLPCVKGSPGTFETVSTPQRHYAPTGKILQEEKDKCVIQTETKTSRQLVFSGCAACPSLSWQLPPRPVMEGERKEKWQQDKWINHGGRLFASSFQRRIQLSPRLLCDGSQNSGPAYTCLPSTWRDVSRITELRGVQIIELNSVVDLFQMGIVSVTIAVRLATQKRSDLKQ